MAQTFTWVPDENPSKTTKAEVNKAKFGDGYSQRGRDNINSVWESWQVAFTARTLAEINAIDDFLAGAKGVAYFWWTTPRGVLLKFSCETWTTTYRYNTDNDLTATFNQEFDVS